MKLERKILKPEVLKTVRHLVGSSSTDIAFFIMTTRQTVINMESNHVRTSKSTRLLYTLYLTELVNELPEGPQKTAADYLLQLEDNYEVS